MSVSTVAGLVDWKVVKLEPLLAVGMVRCLAAMSALVMACEILMALMLVDSRDYL